MKTGGRRKGTPNKATAKREAEIAASGLTPLEFMLGVMRDEKETRDVRLDAAKSAAPYVHPKLASVNHRGQIGVYDLTKATDEQLDQIEAILGALADTGGDQGREGEAGG
ncbi:hypothetical protein [Rhodoplanes serenus]|uniref:hypothetical protein n=1 Tax=Rhodoplanes serenus TaxID=200615 RepID=UPI001FE1522C|nr:hypothetical protein [Rhodoplanes serenus]